MSDKLSRANPRPSAVAARIRAERQRLGLGVTETADHLGVRKQTYAQLERTANPRLTTLIRLVMLGFDLQRIAPELFPARPRGQ